MRAADLRGPGIRLRVARLILVALFLLLALRAAHLTLFDERGSRRGEIQTVASLELQAARGFIFDRNGAELGLSVEAPSVYAVPRAVQDPRKTAQALARVLGHDPVALRQRLERNSSFAFLARWISATEASAVRELELEGIGILAEPRREYPAGALAAQVIGFANIDGQGVRGIEQQEEDWLRGTTQHLAVERDGRRRLVVGAGIDPRAAAGGDVALSLDATLQADAESALEAAVQESGAIGGLVVSLDAHSGEILALAERPTFDLNDFRNVDYASTRSRVFLDSMEPGSTFKLFAIAAALSHGVVGPEDPVDTGNGAYRIPGKTIRDHHPRGILSVAEVLQVSSNVGTVKIAEAVGPEAHHGMLRNFGFGRRTGSGFPDEAHGLMRSWKKWRRVDHATVAFGQGVSVTPIQLAAATAALANRGTWVEPHLVTARRRAGGSWVDAPPGKHRQVVSAEVAAAMLQMMEGVVGPDGTGSRAVIPGLRVAGKTGTAQKFDRASGSYSQTRYVAWFVGVAPMDDPRLVVVVALDEPKGLHTGGAVAAPLFAQVAGAQLVRLGYDVRAPKPSTTTLLAGSSQPPVEASKPVAFPQISKTTESSQAGRRTPIESNPQKAPPDLPTLTQMGDRYLLPDLSGLTAGEVRRVIDGFPVRVEFQGQGRVVQQDPEPGTIVGSGRNRIRVRLTRASQSGGRG